MLVIWDSRCGVNTGSWNTTICLADGRAGCLMEGRPGGRPFCKRDLGDTCHIRDMVLVSGPATHDILSRGSGQVPLAPGQQCPQHRPEIASALDFGVAKQPAFGAGCRSAIDETSAASQAPSPTLISLQVREDRRSPEIAPGHAALRGDCCDRRPRRC